MNINLKLRGIPEKIVKQMIEEGIAGNKTEAIRIALLFFGANFGKIEFNSKFTFETLKRIRTERPIKAKNIEELFE